LSFNWGRITTLPSGIAATGIVAWQERPSAQHNSTESGMTRTMAGADPTAQRPSEAISGELPKIVATRLERSFTSKTGVVNALGPLDVRIDDGEFVCLVGPSGCGKSTFVKVVAGLLDPTAGHMQISFDGTHLSTIATVFQDYGVFPWMKVQDNVTFALHAKGVSKKDATEQARLWLSKLGLTEFADAYPSTLSGGMRQRVAIARAFAMDPEILLMDEPFAALDAQLREILQEELLQLCQTGARRTVLFVTHSLDEAILLGDRVIVMTNRPGRLLDDKRIPFARPRGPEVRSDPAFGALRTELWDHLRNEVEARIATKGIS
jgi:NitT/TauT family transport system ATP-binding protein